MQYVLPDGFFGIQIVGLQNSILDPAGELMTLPHTP